MVRKQKKSKQEKVAEDFFPIDETSVKNAIEKKQNKEIKEVPKKIIEKKGIKKNYEKRKQKRNSSKKSKKNISKKIFKEYKIPNITLKKDGYELIITEKPQAALKLASALGNFTVKQNNKVQYYEVDRNNKKIIVACAAGHLFGLRQIKTKVEIPMFEVDWYPSFINKKNYFTKKYYDTILKLAKGSGSLTVATDFDIEGEVIGANIVRLICNQKDASRMKFSTLTKEELNQAYEKKSDSLDWGQEKAGEARHYLDWFYGINLSRALIKAIQTTGKFKLMSIGRIRGPTLNLIVQREKEIMNFKPRKYWNVFIILEKGKTKLKYQKNIFDKKELESFEEIIGKSAEVQTEKKEKIIPPNPPFNLTTLQIEAYRLYGITPINSLRIAQSLYLKGMISYPRTSSQKLPSSIDYLSILNKLKNKYNVSKLITKDKPIEGKKTDPAHPSIYPTGNETNLEGNEKKIYELIVKRFLSLFCDDAVVERKKIIAKVDKKNFSKTGVSIKKKAWMEIYPQKIKEEKLNDLNGKIKIIDKEIEEKQTNPPKRYSPATIISELEKRNLGTKATRASILETLYNRGYIKGKSIEATPVGISLIDTLNKYSPIITNESLTRELQKKIDSLVNSEKDIDKKEKEIINKAKENVIKILKGFMEKQKEIGRELLNAELEKRELEKRENTLNLCPKCKKGHLHITYSPKNKKFFVACDAYPECKNTYSLPPGKIIKAGKNCEKCGFPLLISLRPGKRPWTFCFNPECETNKERIEKYKSKKR